MNRIVQFQIILISGSLTLLGCGEDASSTDSLSAASLNGLVGTYDVALASCSSVTESTNTTSDFTLSVSGNHLTFTFNFGGCVSTVVSQITSLNSTSMSVRYVSNTDTGTCDGVTHNINDNVVNYTYVKSGKVLKLTDSISGGCIPAIQR